MDTGNVTDLKLSRENIKDVMALTPLQEGMLFHYLRDPHGDFYFEQLSLGISGEMSISIFEQAWNVVVDSNEMLRTVFRWEKIRNPTQAVLKEYRVRVRYIDAGSEVSSLSEAAERLEAFKAVDREEKFDLREVPFRVTLYRLAGGRYEMIVSNHHILYDGWSTGIILKEFFSAYNDLVSGKSPAILSKRSFKQYVRWLQSRDTHGQEMYWREYLRGVEPGNRTELPIKRRYARENMGEAVKPGASVYRFPITFSPGEENRWEKFIKEIKITPAALLYGAWGVLLQRYVNSGDVVFGTTVSGRSARVDGIEDMVGLFINTVPLRFREEGEQWERSRVGDVLATLNETLRAREAHEHTPLVKIYEYCGCASDSELFDILAAVENYPLDIRRIRENGSLRVESYSMVESTHYDLTVVIRATESIDVEFLYREAAFESEVIRRLGSHFDRMIGQIVENPDQAIGDIDLLSPGERRKILTNFNDTRVDHPGNRTLHGLFEQQAARMGDRTALTGKTASGPFLLTYGELDGKSRERANALARNGVKPGDIAAIKMERSVEMVVSILGILKSGAAYLPIDPDHPEDRVNYMLTDSRATVVVEKAGIRALRVKACLEACLNDRHSDSGLAYIIYTSGSTGRPKGVMVEHRSIINTLSALHRRYPFGEKDVYLLKTSYLFDVSVAELFGWYWGGGRLAVLGPGAEKEPRAIMGTVERMGVTHINFVPTMFTAFVERLTTGDVHKLSSLKYMFLAGEALLPGPVKAFRRLDQSIAIENIYGPTEASIYAAWYSLSRWDGVGDIPIGTPVDNINLFILDRGDRLRPVGVPGELVISGVGLARGYLNRPELTAEKFNSENGTYWTGRTFSKIYRTGDLAVWRGDGNIDFLGRIDQQVKVRGFRIELGEIENRLVGYPSIREAVVTAREDRDGDRYLCAYIVPGDEGTFDSTVLREYLESVLPGYMVPSYFTVLPELPRTGTGKVSRHSLPEPQVTAGKNDTAPADAVEVKLVQVWQDVLSLPVVGIDDNFFRLGGHSLKATRLLAAVLKEFGIKIEMQALFNAPTIRELSALLRAKRQGQRAIILPEEKKEYYPLSSAQRRLFFEQRIDPSNTGYNIPVLLELREKTDIRYLEEIFRALIERHESFRTSFIMLEDGPAQRVHDAGGEEFHISSLEQTRKNPLLDFIRPFDLSTAPLLRVGFGSGESDSHLLIIDTHHIISDGISETILVNEFISLYRGESLLPLRIRYRDYSRWQCLRREEETYRRQEAYWLKEFDGIIPRLGMPIDFPRPLVRSYEGELARFRMSSGESALLIELARKEGVTFFMVLLAIYNVFLSRVSTCNCEDIVVGVPAAGRGHADLNAVIGMFVNNLALRNRPRGDMTFGEFLKEVKQKTLSAFENQDYQFEDLVQRVLPERDAARNPLFDVMLTFNNWEDRFITNIPDTPGVKGIRRIESEEMEYKIARFDLILHCYLKEGVFHFIFEYSTRLYKKETVERFAAYFKKVSAAVLNGPNRRLADIQLIDDEEKRDLLRGLGDKKDRLIMEHAQKNKSQGQAAVLTADFDF